LIHWLGNLLGPLHWWRTNPLSIPCASLVHRHLVRQSSGGGGLLVGRFIRDDFVGFVIEAFPAVFLLAGDDKDPLACRGLAEAGDVESCDFAQAGLGGGNQAEVGDVPALSTAGTARGLAEDHDVLGHGAGDG
jgi:hypothetical protein